MIRFVILIIKTNFFKISNKKFYIVDKKIFFRIKIKLLYISFKILYLNNESIIFEQIEWKNNLNFLYNCIFSNCFNETKSIFIAHKLSQNYMIQEVARSIINIYNSKKNKSITLTQQYLNKFQYLYYNNLSYYEHSNLKLNYNDIAINNLYIIIKCYRNKNISLLTEYLYEPFTFIT